jgi:hypothetical protein
LACFAAASVVESQVAASLSGSRLSPSAGLIATERVRPRMKPMGSNECGTPVKSAVWIDASRARCDSVGTAGGSAVPASVTVCTSGGSPVIIVAKLPVTTLVDAR